MAIEFMDPPATATRPGSRVGGKFGADADVLRENAGKSARLDHTWPTKEAARNFAGQVVRGKRKGFDPAGAFDAFVDVQEDGTAHVFVKYVGE